ncbi:MAG TPA: CxxxxCH/CxxCH domain-containing protein [Polyangia bacterium]
MALLAVFAAGCGVAHPPDGRPCGSAAACEAIHPAGIADPQSPDFHGTLLQSNGWNLGSCTKCHGTDFAGGTSGRSCLKCHSDGPTACTVCHDLPPKSGAHVAHAKKYDCTACHHKPQTWDEPGHLFAADGSVIKTPQVTAAWDGTRCSNTYCHGDATPAWNGGPAEATCGSCHKIPPANHASNRCGDCHGRVADNSATIVNDALHVDGKVSLGDDSGTCLACHPSPGGAHKSHATAPHALRGPIGCPECHVVPTAIDSPGHIDHPTPQVFPPGSGTLSRANGAMPTWDGMQCSGTYCHGNATPTWVPGNGAATCGSCHAIPPATAAHAGVTSLAACATCHPTTMNPSGAIIVGGTHLDGVVNAQ